ncbi:unnamed protein product, partial [Rotaria magnacalcarata]
MKVARHSEDLTPTKLFIRTSSFKDFCDMETPRKSREPLLHTYNYYPSATSTSSIIEMHKRPSLGDNHR